MQNYQRPILKPKTKTLKVLVRPLTGQQQSLDLNRDKITLTDPAVRVRKTLKDAIDYSQLTPTQQSRWEAGTFGSIELKTIKGHQYYYLRWKDPETGKYRSTYLGKGWEKATAKMQKLTA